MSLTLDQIRIYPVFCLNDAHPSGTKEFFFLFAPKGTSQSDIAAKLLKLGCPLGCKESDKFEIRTPLTIEEFFELPEEEITSAFFVEEDSFKVVDLNGIKDARAKYLPDEQTGEDSAEALAVKIDIKGLDAHLESRIIGQPVARKKVVRRTRVATLGLVDPSKPKGIFFLMGPPGSGKTKFAEEFCRFVTGSPDELLVLDMNRYQDRFSSNNLTGSPPGYVGYGDASELAAVADRSIAVVLLDEFEKAETSVWRMFLRIFDKGRLAVRVKKDPDDPKSHSAEMKVITFGHCFFFITSNIGSEKMLGQIEGRELGFRAPTTGKDLDPENKLYEIGKSELERECRERRISEFIRRIHEIIVFHPLAGEETLNAIIDVKMMEYEEKGIFRATNLTVRLSEEARAFIRERCEKKENMKLGASSIELDIEHYVFDALARGLEEGAIKPGDTVLIRGPIPRQFTTQLKYGMEIVEEVVLEFEVVKEPLALTDGKGPSGTQEPPQS